MLVQDEGTIVLLTPTTPEEMAWLSDNCDAPAWSWLGNSLAVDHRFAQDILDALGEHGFDLEGR